MPKNPNSRPDIQVLEDRVVRLKSQIEEFQGLRLYKVSKQRLARVCSDLEECVSILAEITGDVSPIPATAVSSEYVGDGLSEFSIDGTDLTDRLSIDTPETNSSLHYSPRDIVSSYSKRLQNCADTIGCSSGIIQVNQFSQILNSWYQSRFTPIGTQRNPKFLFKASKIPEYIDLFMIAAGDALYHGMFPAFLSDMRSWIDDLNTPKDPSWALPYSVMQAKKSNSNMYSKEAVLLEKILKPSLYDESFYVQKMHTIENAYVETFEVPKEDLSLDQIIRDCPKLIVTSSFDATKYEAVG